MQFYLYIKQLTRKKHKGRSTIITAGTFLLLSLLMSCSSSTNDTDENQEVAVSEVEELKAISDELVAMVETKTSDNKKIMTNKDVNVASDKTVAKAVKNKNLYLEQQTILTEYLPKIVHDDYQQALMAMSKKDWEKANVLFDKIILKQPQLSGVYVNKSLIAMARNKKVIAQFQITKALNTNKLNPYAHNIQGQLSRLAGDFNKAEQSYLTALNIWPDYAEVHWNYAVLLELYRGRFLDAKSYYLSFQQLLPDDEQVKRSIAGLDIKIARAGN